MQRKAALDGVGLAALLAVQALLAFNQIVVKLVNAGLQPVFFAGLRSCLAVFFVWAWLAWRGRPPRLHRATVPMGLLIGAVFAGEFLSLFMALDLTSVGRASVLFYSMPLWFAVMAHFGLPGERITPLRGLGLVLAFAGTAVAILGRGAGSGGSLAGDVFGLLAAFGWAGTAFLARRPVMAKEGPEMQLFWMVLVSGPILLAVAPLFGPLIRDFQPVHIAGLLFQAGVVVAGGFIAWLWLLSVYPAALVASFSFLTPILAIGLDWLIFGTRPAPGLIVAAALVGAGITLINRRA